MLQHPALVEKGAFTGQQIFFVYSAQEEKQIIQYLNKAKQNQLTTYSTMISQLKRIQRKKLSLYWFDFAAKKIPPRLKQNRSFQYNNQIHRSNLLSDDMNPTYSINHFCRSYIYRLLEQQVAY